VPNVDDFFLGRFWVLEHVKKRFDKEGVEIPFPYRTLVYKKDLPPPRIGEPVTGNSD
jgi:small-conductance mechanosensitive channel